MCHAHGRMGVCYAMSTPTSPATSPCVASALVLCAVGADMRTPVHVCVLCVCVCVCVCCVQRWVSRLCTSIANSSTSWYSTHTAHITHITHHTPYTPYTHTHTHHIHTSHTHTHTHHTHTSHITHVTRHTPHLYVIRTYHMTRHTHTHTHPDTPPPTCMLHPCVPPLVWCCTVHHRGVSPVWYDTHTHTHP